MSEYPVYGPDQDSDLRIRSSENNTKERAFIDLLSTVC